MRNYYLYFILFSSAFAANNDKIEIMAENLSATETTITADGNVVVHYGDSTIQSSSAVYDKETHILTLDGKKNELLGYKGTKIESKEMKINTQSKKVTFKNIFMTDNNDIWVYSDHATKLDDNMTFGPTMMSSCDLGTKDWSLYSGSAHYDGKEHYMTMRNVKMKFWDVPVFYTPYLGFSTHKERSSGLLFPSFGYSKTDGFVYEQPIYWAASESWDVELRPQVRSVRGGGIYGTLRFVDSPYSGGAIRMGYFKDNADYTIENDMKNDSHYGLEAIYDSSSIVNRFLSTNYDIVDGLYLNATLLNDVDYIYLQKSQMGHFGTNSLQESRLNYFIHNDDFSGGLYAKYFFDTRAEDNDETMQILPTLQLHKYLKSLVLDRLTYSLDLTMNNYTRKKGTELKVAEFYAPIEYSHTFFDDFITLSLKEDLYYNTLMFGNGEFAEDNYQYHNAITRIKLYSDLTKKYSDFIHVLQPSLTYSIPGNGVESPVPFEELEEDQKRLYAPGVESKHLAIKFSQYFYDDSGDMVFYERFTQNYYPEKEEYKFGDFAHEMELNLDHWKFYNSLLYSFEFEKIKEMSSEIRWSDDGYGISLRHSLQRGYDYDDEGEVEERKYNNDVSLNLEFKITDKIRVQGGFVYDVDEELSSQYRLGVSYNRDCWNIALGLRQDIRPIEANDGADSILDNTFTIQINFVPFGGVGLSSNEMERYQ
jgi:LPS-assembly protein